MSLRGGQRADAETERFQPGQLVEDNPLQNSSSKCHPCKKINLISRWQQRSPIRKTAPFPQNTCIYSTQGRGLIDKPCQAQNAITRPFFCCWQTKGPPQGSACLRPGISAVGMANGIVTLVFGGPKALPMWPIDKAKSSQQRKRIDAPTCRCAFPRSHSAVLERLGRRDQASWGTWKQRRWVGQRGHSGGAWM